MRGALGVVALVALMFAVVLLVGFLTLPRTAHLMRDATWLFVSVSVAIGALMGRANRRLEGTVELDDDGVRIATTRGKRLLRRGSYRRGFTLPGAQGVGVAVLERAGSQLRMYVRDRSAAESVLAHMGFQEESAMTVPQLGGADGALTSAFLAVVTVALIIPFDRWLPPGSIYVFTGAGLTLGVAFYRRFGSPKVVVGADGVRLVGTLRPRFFPYAKLVAVKRARDEYWPNVVMQVRAGPAAADTVEETLALREQPEAVVAALIQRIEQGIARTRASRLLAPLAREERTVAEWRQALSRAVGTGTFRQQPVLAEDLAAVLQDATASPEERIGAALALRDVETDAAPRIRVAAQTCADDTLRAALESLAQEDADVDEAAIEAALRRR